MNPPQAWKTAQDGELKAIRGVCLDIDDTLSTRGKLTAPAYQALWKLKEAGLFVVPLTGRPAGWCDHIARFWPVDAVVGENGAFTFAMKGGVRTRVDTPFDMTAEQARARLASLRATVVKEFPNVRFASDQAYREFDLAIDIREDVEPWSEREVDRLLGLCAAQGAHAKLSSIHVNAWYGDYDKYTGFTHWLVGQPPQQQSPQQVPRAEEWLFIGDSPNDEPLFARFKYTVGVANLKPYLPRLKHAPKWLTEGVSGKGFVEMVERLVQLRGAG